jgi:GlpG protein
VNVAPATSGGAVREIGTIADERAAEVFKDVLLTRKIASKVVKSRAGWAIWVIDEDAVPVAKEQLTEFLAAPDANRYRDAVAQAREIEKAAATAERSDRAKVLNLRDRWDAPVWRKYPLTIVLIAMSAYVGLSTGFGELHRSATFRAVTLTRDRGLFGEADEHSRPIEELRQSDAIRKGEVWRFVTPIFLHFGMIHLFFNMLWLRVFGGLIEFRKGTLRFLILVLVSAIASNLGQFFADTQRTEATVFGGMSGVCYALFGYLMTKGYSRPEERLGVNSNTVVMMLVWFILCAIGANGPVANTAHGVGLIVGMMFGLTPF